MKKFYTLCAAMLMASSMLMGAQELSNTTTQWAKALTTQWTTQGSDIALAYDHSGIFAIGGAGTKTLDEEVKLGDDVIATGTLYTGTSTSGNQELFLSKIATDGTPEWTVYSTNGEVANNTTFVAATHDGGAVAVLKFRHTDGHITEQPVIVDGTGKTFNVDWTLDATGKRYYNGLVIKVNKNGAISWIKMIEVNHDPQPNATGSYATITSEAFYPKGVVVDANDNIFIGGNMRAELYVPKADGSLVTIPVHNVEGWNGDSQKSVGNLFVLKLDKNGNYAKHVVTTGTASCEQVQGMNFKDGKIYLFNTVVGVADNTFGLGNFNHTATHALGGLSLARLDTDLNVDYFTYEENAATKVITIQTPNVTTIGDNVWVACKAGNFDVAGVSTGTLTRAGVFIKADAATGEIKGGHVKATNQAGYFGAFEDSKGNVYAVGQALFGPLTVEKLDIETLEVTDNANLQSSTSDAQGVVVDGDVLYAMTRGMGNTTYIGSDITTSSTKYSCILSSYKLPTQVTTAIDQVNVEESNGPVNVYTIDGRLVRKQVVADNATEGLDRGLYIVGGKKVLVK